MADQRTPCQKVYDELQEVKIIRAAYADRDLLAKADRENWDGDQYNNSVKNALFPGKPSKPPARSVDWNNPASTGNADVGELTAVSPMSTDPYTCKIVERWSKQGYKDRGFPEVVYTADRAHEEVHRKSCLPDSQKYVADMSFPAKRSVNELAAYDEKIKILEKWMKDNCANEPYLDPNCRVYK